MHENTQDSPSAPEKASDSTPSPSHAAMQAPRYAQSPLLSQSPMLDQSPYRLPYPLVRANSGGDLVLGIVEKFESFSVTDRHEEQEKHDRQIAKLKAALDRAQMAREEAETEARKLREKLLDLQDERQRERTALRERAQDFEKKYDKAKERFKLQRAKNDDAMHKAQKEHLEREKKHWRALAAAEDEVEWEKKLRTDVGDLLDFMQMEQYFHATVSSRNTSKMGSRPERRTPAQDMREDKAARQGQDSSVPASTPQEALPERRPQPRRDPLQSLSLESLTVPDAAPPPTTNPRTPFPAAIETPRKQHPAVVVPVDFGDDKENRTPTQHHSLPSAAGAAPHTLPRRLPPAVPADDSSAKTPQTIDRAAALAAIQYRRGRAKSFMEAQGTPKRFELLDRRDVSAPPLIAMTVGRSGSGLL